VLLVLLLMMMAPLLLFMLLVQLILGLLPSRQQVRYLACLVQRRLLLKLLPFLPLPHLM
jgi:hypothetical protein